uniref:SRCR domain-containing protein n=1 Tax=Amphimedon queenslandica TaxID=400682 RepID=A0A1X7U8B7_AMPQE
MGLLSVLLLLIGLIYTAHCQNRGTVRLVRNEFFSPFYTAGIVQIYYFTSTSSANRWGNICDDISFVTSWGIMELQPMVELVAHQGKAVVITDNGLYVYGTDFNATLLDDVSCSSSNYLTLQQCTLTTFISSTCSLDSYDAYVVCYTTRIWNNPYSGQIHLVGGNYSSYGRLEVYCNGQWGTVCDDTFGSTDARVACRQLGYSDYSTYTGNLAGSSSQPIWLDSVYCSSSYSCLATCESCPSSEYHNCRHNEDVALGCEFDSFQLTSRNTLSTCRYADNRWGSSSTTYTSTSTTTFYTHSTTTSYTHSPTSTSTSSPRTNRSNGRTAAIIGGTTAAFIILSCGVLMMMITILCLICRFSAIRYSATAGQITNVTVATSANATAPPPPPAYNQQPPPAVAPYPPQQGYPAQAGYPPQEGYPPQGYAYPPQGYEAEPPQHGYNSPPPAYPAAKY